MSTTSRGETPATEYRTPDGRWVSQYEARRLLLALADRLDAIGCRDRGRFARDRWQVVAARPSLWSELESFTQETRS